MPHRLRPHIFRLLILALLTAGISPACRFISGGETLMEICSLEGMKTVSVPGDASEEQQNGQANPCGFCVLATTGTVIAPLIEIIPAEFAAVGPDVYSLALFVLPGETFTVTASPRGPPLFS